MNIDGWAYTENEDEKEQENRTMEFHSVTVKCIQDYVVVERTTPGYAHTTYTGYLKEGHPPITLKELLVFLDGGNLCFGGRGYINSDGKFEAIVHTD